MIIAQKWPDCRAKACKFVSLSWKPQFGASHTVQASQALPPKTLISEDDSIVVNVETTCDVSKIAYASVMFTAESPLSSKVVLMKQGKSRQHLKGQLKAAELKPLVCFAGCYMSLSLIALDGRLMPTLRFQIDDTHVKWGFSYASTNTDLMHREASS